MATKPACVSEVNRITPSSAVAEGRISHSNTPSRGSTQGRRATKALELRKPTASSSVAENCGLQPGDTSWMLLVPGSVLRLDRWCWLKLTWSTHPRNPGETLRAGDCFRPAAPPTNKLWTLSSTSGPGIWTLDGDLLSTLMVRLWRWWDSSTECHARSPRWTPSSERSECWPEPRSRRT